MSKPGKSEETKGLSEDWVLVPREPTEEMVDAATESLTGSGVPDGDYSDDFRRALRAALAAAPSRSADPPAEGTIDPEEIVADAYQVIGSLSEIAGVFDHPEIQRALDYLGFDDRRNEPLCPWPRTPIVPLSSDRDRLEKRVREAEEVLHHVEAWLPLIPKGPGRLDLLVEEVTAFLADKPEAGE